MREKKKEREHCWRELCQWAISDELPTNKAMNKTVKKEAVRIYGYPKEIVT